MTDIDFQAHFRTIGHSTRPLRYRVRSNSNFVHDIEFVNGLVHDATFRVHDISGTKRHLEVPITRIRWEQREEVAGQQVTEALATLHFRGVSSVRWVAGDICLAKGLDGHLFDKSDTAAGQATCQIYRVFVAESTYSTSSSPVEVVLTGYPAFWQLRIVLLPSRWSIELTDQPLHS